MFRGHLKKPVKDKEHAHCLITDANNHAVKAAKVAA